MDWRSVFDPESYAWKPFGYIADIFLLSFLWILFSIPLITIGAATAALYDCVAHGIRYKERDIYSRFFQTFKREFLGTIPSVLLWGIILGLGYWLLSNYVVSSGATDLHIVVSILGLMGLIFVSGIGCWVFPLLSRFTFNFPNLNITSLQLALSHPLKTLILGLAFYLSLYLSVSYIVPIFVFPALLELFFTFILEPVFKAYTD